MHRLVWEWCEDDWNENYNGALSDGKARLIESNDKKIRKVLRGGSWNYNPRG
jgi:formylglycine-generating enzyme required for sulfatase activity